MLPKRLHTYLAHIVYSVPRLRAYASRINVANKHTSLVTMPGFREPLLCRKRMHRHSKDCDPVLEGDLSQEVT